MSEYPLRQLDIKRGWRNLIRMRFNSKLMHLISQTPGRLLDIGCGTGQFLATIKKHGWDVRGCDFDAAAVTNVRESFGIAADVGAVEHIGYETSYFDAITANNVIEHLPDPRATLSEIYRILRKNGKFVSRSPNPDSFLHQRFGRDWRGLEVPRHLFLYNPRTLAILAKEAGFKRVMAWSASTQDSLTFLERESEKITQARLGAERKETRISSSERLALKLLPLSGFRMGEMTILLCEK